MRIKPPLVLAFFGLGAMLFGVSLFGCSQQTLDSARHDARHNAATLSQQAQAAEREAQPQVDRLKLQSRVTAALTAANLSPAVHVRADAEGIYLRGTVNTAADKARAGQIARDTLGPGRKVHNQLQVSGE